MEPQCILILLDEPQFPLLVEGEPPVFNYSHDKNLFQFAHEALRKGHRVVMCSAQRPAHDDEALVVQSTYPVWSVTGETIPSRTADPDIVVSVYPDALNLRHVFPEAKIVAIVPALHWIEDPGLFSGEYMFRFVSAFRDSIDFVVTQNERMKDIVAFMVHLLARVPFKDRILVAPQGIVGEIQRRSLDRGALRRSIGVQEGDIMIVNSGGVWKWTDFTTFFEAFCEFHTETPDHPFKLFVMGITQEFNTDHDDYVAEFRSVLERYKEILGDRLTLFEDWNEGGKFVADYTAVADIGINVSQETLESWQSYRMRFLDYMYDGIPAINTVGDSPSSLYPDALFLANAGDKDSYKQLLKEIADEPDLVRQKSARMRALAEEYDSKSTYGVLIDEIIAREKRADDEPPPDESIIGAAQRHGLAAVLSSEERLEDLDKAKGGLRMLFKRQRLKKRYLREWRQDVLNLAVESRALQNTMNALLQNGAKQQVNAGAEGSITASLSELRAQQKALIDEVRGLKQELYHQETGRFADPDDP